MSTCWCEAATPRSAAEARSAPHSHSPSGKCGTVSSGSGLQARCDPGAPGCPPGLRPPPPRFGLGAGGLRPGRSSAEGAIEELPLLRPSRRRSSRTSAASATRSARSSSIAAACSAITASRAAHEAQPGAGGGRTAITGHHHRRPAVIKPTRRADPGNITTRQHRTPSPKPGHPANGDLNVYHLCLMARRFWSNRSGLETPVQLANASPGVLLGEPLGLLQCKEPSRVRVERNERKHLRWALIREVPTPR